MDPRTYVGRPKEFAMRPSNVHFMRWLPVLAILVVGLAWRHGAQAAPPSSPVRETDTAIPSPTTEPGTPTATPLPGGDVTVTGLVLGATGGPGMPLVGAVVSVKLSVGDQSLAAATGADGRYSLLVPAVAVTNVERIDVTATGYAPVSQPVTGDELRQHPVRDFTLALLVASPTPEGAKPDLIVTGEIRFKGFTGRCVPAPPQTEIIARVTNCCWYRHGGAGPAGPFKVRTDNSGVEWSVPGLAGSQSIDLPAQVGNATTITVDPDNQVQEYDETNNTFTLNDLPSPPICTPGAPTYFVEMPMLLKDLLPGH
jgi:hypothetical protein